MRVLIKSSMCKEVISAKNGKHYFFQTAALDTGDDFPRSFEILHDDQKKAYPLGQYEFAPDAVYVSRDGNLSVSSRLVPMKSSAPKV